MDGPLPSRQHLLHRGPLVTAAFAAAIPALQLVAFMIGMQITMTTVLAIVLPAVTVSVILVSVSMGWIFILIGRLHRKPAKLPATIVLLGVAMLALLAIIVICGRAGAAP